jgi:hypothetical protein
VGHREPGHKEFKPSIEYLVGPRGNTENFNEYVLLVDLFIEGARKADQAVYLIEKLTDSPVSQWVEGEPVWMLHQDTRELEFPSDKKVTHRQIEFLFRYVRDEALA